MSTQILIKDATLVLPLPPSVNKYWENARINRRSIKAIEPGGSKTYNGRKLSKKAKNYRIRFTEAFLTQGYPRFGSSPIAVEVDLHPRESNSQQKGDIDNFHKGLFDAATKAGVWEDDSQIIMLSTRLRRPIPGGGIVMSIRVATYAEVSESKAIHELFEQIGK